MVNPPKPVTPSPIESQSTVLPEVKPSAENLGSKAARLREKLASGKDDLLGRMKKEKTGSQKSNKAESETFEGKFNRLIEETPDPKKVERAGQIADQIYMASRSADNYPGFPHLMAALIFKLRESGLDDPATVKAAFRRLGKTWGGEEQELSFAPRGEQDLAIKARKNNL